MMNKNYRRISFHRRGLALLMSLLMLLQSGAGFAEAAVVDESDPVSIEGSGLNLEGFTPQYFEGTLVHEGADYTVTAVIGQDAQFPQDVRMRVEEILPGTPQYREYAEMTDAALDGDWSEIDEFARFFDIAFLGEKDGEDVEIEPAAYIDVQITFKEAIPVAEDVEVQAVHFESKGAEAPSIIKTSTDSVEAAVNDDAAIDTVSFSSDSFSVYGVVRKVKKILKVITANGDNYTIDVNYSQEAGIPDNAELIATEITEDDPRYAAYRDQTAMALNADGVRMAGLFDIGVYVDGEKINIEAPVQVQISKEDTIAAEEPLYVVHFPEDLPEEVVTAAAEKAAEATGETAAVPAQETQASNANTPATDPATETPTEAPIEPETVQVQTEVSQASVEGETASFEATGFSVYALAYTVDFHYEDENGNVYEWSYPGRGKYPVKDILEAIGGEGEITDVTLELKEGELVEGALYLTKEENEWFLNSDVAFTDTYELTIATDSQVYIITVTDEALVYEILLNDDNAGYIGNAGSRNIDQKDKNGNYLYIYDIIWKNEKIVGYKRNTVDANPSFSIVANEGYRYAYSILFYANGAITTTKKSTLAWEDYNGVQKILVCFTPNEKGYLVAVTGPRNQTQALNDGSLRDYSNTSGLSYIKEDIAFFQSVDSGDKIGVNDNSTYEFLGYFNGRERVTSEKIYYASQASKDMLLIPMFWKRGDAKRINISVNNTSWGEVRRDSTNEEYTGSRELNNNATLKVQFTAHSIADSVFLHWSVNGIPVPELPRTLNSSTQYTFIPGDELQAVFGIPTEITSQSNTSLGKKIPDKDELLNWAKSLNNNELIQNADKTAKVHNPNNRIYQIDLSAESGLRKLSSTLDVAFILDMSGSMRFPSHLEPVQRNGQNLSMVLTQNNLNEAFPGEDGPYYIISDPSHTSTVYKIYRKDGVWGSTDGSFSNHNPITGTERFNDPANGVPYKYVIYRDADPGVTRLNSLNAGLNNAITSATKILQNANGINGDNTLNVAFSRFAYKAFTEKGQYTFTPVSSTSPLNFTDSDTDGGTRQDLALEDAAANFDWSNQSHSKYAILITDGAPVISGGDINEVIEAIPNKAQALKDKGVTLITVGLSTRNVDKGSELLSDIASNGLFYDADYGDELQYILMDILRSIMAEANICADVTDTIDPLFYPVLADGTPIREGYYSIDGTYIENADAIDFEQLDNTYHPYYQWIKNSNGSWTIKWHNVPVGWKKDNKEFHKQFYVKAKEDFLGGNAMPTNLGPATIKPVAIYAGNISDAIKLTNATETQLDTPYVNVKELAFTQSSSEITVPLRAEVDPITAVWELFNQIDVQKLVSGDTDNMITYKNQMLNGQYSEENIIDLFSIIKNTTGDAVTKNPKGDGMARWAKMLFGGSDNTLKIRYPYGSHYRVGEIWITLNQETVDGETGITGSFTDNNNCSLTSEHATAVSGNAVEKYTLTVKYVPRAAQDREEQNNVPLGTIEWHTTPEGSAGVATGEITSVNTHIINVNDLPTTEIKVGKIWNNGTAPAGASVEVKLGRYKLVQETAGDNGENPDTGNGSGSNGSEGTEPGNTGENGSGGSGGDAGTGSGEGTPAEKHTITVSPYPAGPDPLVYPFEHGTNVNLIFNCVGNEWRKENYKEVHVLVDGEDHGKAYSDNINTIPLTVNNDISIVLTNTGYENFGEVTKGMTIERVTSGRNSIMDLFFAPAYADDLQPTIRLNADITPPAVEGYTWVKDESWTTGNSIVLNGSSWNGSLTVEASDSNGNPYIYYIAKADEYGVDSTLWNASIDELYVWGDHATNDQHEDTPLTVTNNFITPSTGGFKLKKLVEAEASILDAEKQKEFTFTIEILNEDNSVNTSFAGTYGELQFADGKATKVLRHGEEVTVSGLPMNTLYKISESYEDPYGKNTLYAVKVNVDGGENQNMPLIGRITEETLVNVVVTNTKSDTINIVAQKQFTTGSVEPTAVQFTLRRKGDDADTFDVINVATVTAADGWKHEWKNLEKIYKDWNGNTEYTYFVVETGVYFGELTDPIPEDQWISANLFRASDGAMEYDAELGAYTIAITNTSYVDVPVVKNWPDFSDDQYDWYAKFRLLKQEVPLAGTAASTTEPEWTPALDENSQEMTLTVNKGAVSSFEHLDVFSKHEGKVYQLLYKVEETEYKVWKKADNSVVAQWSKDGSLQKISYQDHDYSPVFDNEIAGADVTIPNLQNRYTITLKNMPEENYEGKLVVHKEWLDILPEDLSNFPEVYFTLYYLNPANHETDANQAHLYTDGTREYSHIALNYANNWTVPIDNLPDEYRYFVVEDAIIGQNEERTYDQSGVHVGRHVIVDQAHTYNTELYYYNIDGYKSREEYGKGNWKIYSSYNGFVQDVFPYSEPHTHAVGNNGEILIRNRCPAEYMQMDLKKKFLKYVTDDNGVTSLYTTTQEDDTMRNLYIKLQLYRRIVKDDTEPGNANPNVIVPWDTYGYPFLVGYDKNNQEDIRNDPRNPFEVEDAQGTWAYRIPNTDQNQGLPRRGLYKDSNGNYIQVRYQYLFREVDVLDGDFNSIGGKWAAWLPYLWEAKDMHNHTKVQVFELQTAQDTDRILNTPGASMTIQKEWTGSHSNIKEIYVKVLRRTAGTSGNWEDFTEAISKEINLGAISQHYLDNAASSLDKTNKWLVLKEGNNWKVTIHHVPILNARDSGKPYEYRIVEVGYKDSHDVTYTQDETQAEFNPKYYEWNLTTGKFDEQTAGKGFVLRYQHDDYNKLMVRNTIQTTDITILKVDNQNQPLTGATFALEMLTGESGEGTGRYTTVDGYGEIHVGTDGKAKITGLTDGTYRLKETQAPNGFTRMTEPASFTITNGEVSYTAGSNSLVTYAKNNGENGVFTVTNNPGVELPATGGSGTLPYTLAGLGLILLAGAILVSRRRRMNG